MGDMPVLSIDDFPIDQMNLPDGQMIRRTSARGYATALRVEKPRNWLNFQRELMVGVRLLGEDAYYGWGTGKDHVEGGTVKLANLMARLWGNCLAGCEPEVTETDSAWYVLGIFVDLETGYTHQRPYMISKRETVHGKFDPARKDLIRFNRGLSKAARNAVFQVLGDWVPKAIMWAKEGVVQAMNKWIGEKGLTVVQDICVGTLRKHGVALSAILERFGVSEICALKLDDLIVIREQHKAIMEGEARATDFYPGTTTRGDGDQDNSAQAAIDEAKRQMAEKTQPPPAPPATTTPTQAPPPMSSTPLPTPGELKPGGRKQAQAPPPSAGELIPGATLLPPSTEPEPKK